MSYTHTRPHLPTSVRSPATTLTRSTRTPSSARRSPPPSTSSSTSTTWCALHVMLLHVLLAAALCCCTHAGAFLAHSCVLRACCMSCMPSAPSAARVWTTDCQHARAHLVRPAPPSLLLLALSASLAAISHTYALSISIPSCRVPVVVVRAGDGVDRRRRGHPQEARHEGVALWRGRAAAGEEEGVKECAASSVNCCAVAASVLRVAALCKWRAADENGGGEVELGGSPATRADGNADRRFNGSLYAPLLQLANDNAVSRDCIAA